MKLKFNNKYVKWGVTAFLVIAAGISFYYLVFHINDIIKNIGALMNVVMPVVFGFVIAYLLTPILNFIERKILNPLLDFIKIKKSEKRDKWVRAIAIILTSVLFFYSIYALVAMLISQIVPSIQAIVTNFDVYVTDVTTWLNKLFEDNKDLQDFVIPQFHRLSSELENWLNIKINLAGVFDIIGKIYRSFENRFIKYSRYFESIMELCNWFCNIHICIGKQRNLCSTRQKNYLCGI